MLRIALPFFTDFSLCVFHMDATYPKGLLLLIFERAKCLIFTESNCKLLCL